MTIKKYPVAQVIILFDNPQIPIKPAKIGAKTIPKKTNSKKNSNGAKDEKNIAWPLIPLVESGKVTMSSIASVCWSKMFCWFRAK